MTYLNVVEVESAIKGLASGYPGVAELIELPNKTIEGRTCHALRIGADANADAVLFVACQHAREWGSAEICVFFASDLLEAYANRTGVRYGGTSFAVLTVRAIIESLNVVIFPCVNPDGRKFDQDFDALWRRNRNPAPSGGDPFKIGVDLNRNYDFLWDFRKKFSPSADRPASDVPGDDVYHGQSPESEPETRNVVWLIDKFRFARWLVDIHSYDGDILFPWGDDTNQTHTPTMNFMNSAYDGQRGVTGGYAEYIPTEDLTDVQGTAQRMTDAVNGVRGGRYVAKQGVFLQGSNTVDVTYPTSGAVDDYTFSRHFANCARPKVYGLTIEFNYPTSSLRISYHPPWDEMEKIVPEIDAGLMELCAATARPWRPPWLVLFRRLWPWEIWDPMVREIEPIIRPILRLLLAPATVTEPRLPRLATSAVPSLWHTESR